mgnify:CR=1 FL=1
MYKKSDNMKVLQINSVCGIRSTGRICTELADQFIAQGHEVKIGYGRETVPERYQSMAVRIGSDQDVYFSALKSRLLDNEGFNNKKATRRFLQWADTYDPDLLWLHNLHGYYINLELLFQWIKQRPGMQVKWTLHDCWAFTGHCAHFTMVDCKKWKTQCKNCSQKGTYPKGMFLDHSKVNYQKKRQCFLGISDLTIITPSHWLASLVRQSFLKDYPIEVRHHSVDTDVFKPTPGDFRKRYGLENKKIVLGVATAWTKSKGLDDFIALSSKLDDTYKIVLVGIPPNMRSSLPGNILALERTNHTKELAEIYTAADVFVNPSREETFGLTTLEAISCGSKTIVYQETACEEVVKLHGCGVAVEQTEHALEEAIRQMFR